ncbi:MAG: chromosome segregation protein SMC, partial [Candidatus Poribacteria bacterium]|nr:chromosome segregation protein SMC [Candidatus Poribacteria bacterium]
MLLNSIKVSGFKSFAEEVELILEPGITTIVGPNGCGKSNVSDAIRWVLGEQSARALRCTNMRDLLFNGGANFSPSQRASVALTFTNISENLSIESPEVEVRRQLTRDGESSYLINQTPCRLRDISELFMDTGVGVDAYSVMEQSKIDLILNVRPEERRFLFDEVAGITKYKVRKKSAIQKLKDTEQNLVRINDIIQELQRETESLKAQAEQAGHYQSLKDQLQQLELGLAYRDYEKLATDYRETQSNLEAILNEVSNANQILQEAEDRIENATLRRTELDAAITTAQEEIREIEGQLEKVERQIVVHKENQLNIQQQKQRAEQTLESLNSQQVNLQTRNRERTQEKKRLEASYKIEESRLTAKQQHLQELTSRIDKTKESIQEAQNALQEISTELSQRENRRIAIEHELTSKQSSLNNLQESSDALKTELKAATDDRDEIQRGMTQLDAELLQIDAEKKQVETKLNENQDALRKIESEIRGLEENLGGSLSRYKSLEQLQSAYEGYYAGVRAIMRAKDHFPDQFAGICDVVAELIDTDTEYEVAIEVALGSAIQNVVAETAEDADTAISFLKKHRAGRVTFLPIDILRRRTFSDDALLDEPGVIGIADELVGYDDKYEKVIQHLLGNTLVLENLDAAVALTRKFRHNARLVTLEGELINTSGAITGGHTDQRKSGLLSRANELDVLKTKIGELQQIVNQKDEKRKAYAATIAEADQTRQRLTGHLQDKQIEKASITKDIEQANQNIDRLETELAEVETRNRQLKETVDLSREDQQTLDAEIAELTKKRTQTEGRIQRVSEQVDSDARKREEVVSDCQEREIFLAGQRQKLESMTEELDNFDEQQLQIEKNIEEQQAIIDSDEQTKHDIVEQIEAAQRKFLRIGGDRAEAEAAHDELTEEREALLEEIETIQKEMRSTRKQFESQNRKQRQLEVKTTQLEMQLKSISTRILDKYQVSIDELPKPTTQDEVSDNEEQSTVPAILQLDEIDLMDNIEKLKAEISAMG